MTQAYLDWNATAQLRPRGAGRDDGGAGRRPAIRRRCMRPAAPRAVWSRRRASRSRRWSALTPRDVVFTSGGTEANMLALSPALGDALLVSAIEHPSVRSGGRFAAAEDIPVTAAASSISRRWSACWRAAARPLVSLMLANNETGVIQPVAEAAAIWCMPPAVSCMSMRCRGRAASLAISTRSAPT